MLNRKLHKRQAGFTIMELLVGMALGVIVMGGAVVLFSSISSSTSALLSSTKMQQELRNAGQVMTRDIRRAGYSGVVPGLDFNGDGEPNVGQTDPRLVLRAVRADILYNPFLDGRADVRVLTSTTTNDCILLTYNIDALTLSDVAVTSGNPMLVEGDEWFGYRRAVLVSGRGVLQSKTAGPSPATCSDSDNTWETISADEIDVTGLTFTMAATEMDLLTSSVLDNKATCEAGEPCHCIRTVGIVMDVALAGDATIKSRMADSIRVRNDKVVTSFVGPTGSGCFN